MNLSTLVGAFAILCVIQSCDGQENNASADKDFSITDTLKRDIPLDGRREYVLGYHSVRQMERKLGLENLSNGVDSIQIRIWYDYSLKDSGQLVLLSCKNDQWNSKLYTYTFLDAAHDLQDTVATFDSRVPKSGWKRFISRLYKLEIATLPDMDKINNSIVIAHGNPISVEYATKNRYRLYQYIDPQDFQNEWEEAKLMENILQLIESEFDFKRLR